MRADHLELFVPDREEAARWYGRLFGFAVPDFARAWADDPGGPLMLERAPDDLRLALFFGDPQDDEDIRGYRRLAFRMDAREFLAFVDNSPEELDPPLDRMAIEDHSKSWSVYFSDPFGNRLEVTTYDYAEVAAALDR